MKEFVLSASREIRDYLRKYGERGQDNVLDRETALLEQFRSSDKERKETEKKAQLKLKEAAKVIEAISGGNQGSSEMMEQFRELQRYYDESLSFNQGKGGAPSQGQALSSDPYDAGKSSMDGMDDAYGSMGVLLEGIRDELFQNEYAVHYFQHFDITRLADAVKDPSSLSNLSDEFAISNQEVEYILYGFHNPAGNIAAAYGEIFASRLAIRTMEGFIVNSKMGNPLLILAAAILYGVEKAIEDMIRLCQKGSVELSKYMPVEVTYRDHLRVFLFVHSNNEKKMSRMLALIRLNTGVNPAERGTYAAGEIVMGTRLWFLPGITKALGTILGSGADRVEGGRYMVTRKADFSY